MRRKTSLSVAENVNRTLTDIARKMGGGKVQVGFLEGATYPDGTPVAAVAYWNEFGHGGNFPSPPRPFFRAMIAKESPSWPGALAEIAKANKFDGAKSLAEMGEIIDGELKQSIVDFNSVPISATTSILRDKFRSNPQDIRIKDVLAAQRAVASGKIPAGGTGDKPLVWTGHMLASTGYQVDEGDEMVLNTQSGKYEARK